MEVRSGCSTQDLQASAVTDTSTRLGVCMPSETPRSAHFLGFDIAPLNSQGTGPLIAVRLVAGRGH